MSNVKPDNLSPAEWMDKARISIMRHPTWVAFSPLLACGTLTFDDKIPTACTDGWNTRFNPDFVAKLALPELRFVVLHEAMHVAFQHLWVWRHLWEKDAQLANIAADTFINTTLQDEDAGAGFIAMPSIGVPPAPQYRGKSVGQIFDDMSKQSSVRKQKQQKQPGFDEHDWNGAAPHNMPQSVREAREREINVALRQGQIAKMRCKIGTGNASPIFEQLTSTVDWVEVLRTFLVENCKGHDESSWRRPSRRYLSQDMYMPSTEGCGAPERVVGVDTSGSCFSSTVMSRFITELTAMIETVNPSRVHVISWDTKVTNHQTFEEGEFTMPAVKPRGGGGTDGACLFEYLRAKRISPGVVLQLTDGEVGSWGRSDWPTLWAVTGRMTAPFGVTLHLNA